ncbi:MAG: GTPase Era [Bacteroidota bacterium]
MQEDAGFDGHKSGFVTIIGKPNAGKSTLLNQILGQKLSIITPKAQTTRHRIFGIDHGEGYQVVYSDTPGLIRPKYKLHNRMMNFIDHSLEDADLILLLIPINETFPEEDLIALAEKTHIPKFLVLNKIDAVEEDAVFLRMKELMDKIDFQEAIPISALKGTNVPKLKELIIKYLPEGPPYFEKDQISDRPERFFIAEMIREKIFLLMQQELPYSTEVEIEKFEEEEKIVRIQATIHTERNTQKGMIIGKGGSMLKKIGTHARKDIEEFLGKKVFLQLYVKISPGWKNNNQYLQGFGY